jgi:tRNA (guanine-N7-)-methyltransferase
MFTKTVIEKYGCRLLEDLDHVYQNPNPREELKIKTHYESLDIAGSNRIHYLKFSLPDNLPGKELDKDFQQYLKEHEATGID